MLVEIAVMSFRVSLKPDIVVKEVNNMGNKNEVDEHEHVWRQLGVHKVHCKLIILLSIRHLLHKLDFLHPSYHHTRCGYK
jgi:hypothetical protein